MASILGLSYTKHLHIVGCISSNKNPIFIAEEKDNQPELTDASLLELSKEINNLADLRAVAIKGLRIANNRVEAHVNHFPNDINSAALALLSEWRKSQPNSKTAYANLIKALDVAERSFVIQAVAKNT